MVRAAVVVGLTAVLLLSALPASFFVLPSGGARSPTSESSGLTLSVAPGPVTSLSVVRDGLTTSNLTWTNPIGALTNFTVLTWDAAVPSWCGNPSYLVGTNSTGAGTNTSFEIFGLSPGNAYCYAVQTWDGASSSPLAWVNETYPSAPKSASAITGAAWANVTYAAPPGFVWGYTIEVYTTLGSWCSPGFSPVAGASNGQGSSPPSALYLNVTGLSPSTSYCGLVFASNYSGNAFGQHYDGTGCSPMGCNAILAQVNFTTQVAPATNLQVDRTGKTTAVLTWTNPGVITNATVYSWYNSYGHCGEVGYSASITSVGAVNHYTGSALAFYGRCYAVELWKGASHSAFTWANETYPVAPVPTAWTLSGTSLNVSFTPAVGSADIVGYSMYVYAGAHLGSSCGVTGSVSFGAWVSRVSNGPELGYGPLVEWLNDSSLTLGDPYCALLFAWNYSGSAPASGYYANLTDAYAFSFVATYPPRNGIIVSSALPYVFANRTFEYVVSASEAVDWSYSACPYAAFLYENPSLYASLTGVLPFNGSSYPCSVVGSVTLALYGLQEWSRSF